MFELWGHCLLQDATVFQSSMKLGVSVSHRPLEKIMVLLRLVGNQCAILNYNLFAWESLSNKHPLDTCCFQNPAPAPGKGSIRRKKNRAQAFPSGVFPHSWSPVSIEAFGSKFSSSTMDLDWEERTFPAQQADLPLNGCPSRLQILLFSEAFRKFSSEWTIVSGAPVCTLRPPALQSPHHTKAQPQKHFESPQKLAWSIAPL